MLQVLAAARDLGNLQLKSVTNYGSLHSLVSVTLGALLHHHGQICKYQQGTGS